MEKLKRPGKVTIRNVAQDAGVSVSAVSKVLRNAYGVSDELRGKVQQSIEKLDYRPSTAARGMRGRTFSIGILLIDMRNPFLPTIVDGVKEVLAEANYQALIGVGEAEAHIERTLIDSMIDMKMDGVLLVAPRLSGELLSHYAAQVPMVVIGHHEATATSFDTVNSDDREGARMAVSSLIESGRRDIHMASLPVRNRDPDVCIKREQGYLDAMAAAGLTERTKIWTLREYPDDPGQPLSTILSENPLPDAVFCWSDIHALRIINEAKMRGIDVPGQLAIIGYDNTPATGYPLIGLSSVDQKGREMGRVAGKAILSRINGRDKAEHSLVQPELVLRKSSEGKSSE